MSYIFGNPSYPSYSVVLSVFFAAALVLVAMPWFIRFMRKDGIGQQVRADGPQSHLVKQGTPIMGGVVIISAVVVACLVLTSWTTELVLALVATVLTAFLGLLDDIASVSHARSLGLTPTQKMVGLFVVSVCFCLFAVNMAGIAPVVKIPGGVCIDLGIFSTVFRINTISITVPWLYLIFVFFLMAGLANAVNLTDGLDGLAGGTMLVVMLFVALVAYRSDKASLAVFAGACAGACIGFLWYNVHPASIFMGDTGSLALGSAFAALAVLTKSEGYSLIMGGLFVVEALSVIIQVASFKLTGKRVFLMAPLHHHFEKRGWEENIVVVRFWILSAAVAAIGFALCFHAL